MSLLQAVLSASSRSFSAGPTFKPEEVEARSIFPCCGRVERDPEDGTLKEKHTINGYPNPISNFDPGPSYLCYSS